MFQGGLLYFSLAAWVLGKLPRLYEDTAPRLLCYPQAKKKPRMCRPRLGRYIPRGTGAGTLEVENAARNDAVDLRKLARNIPGDLTIAVDGVVADGIVAFVHHILDIDPQAAEQCRHLSDHIGNIAVDDEDAGLRRWARPYVHDREVHRVHRRSIDAVLLDRLDRHRGALLLRLGRAGAKMRRTHDLAALHHVDELSRREVGGVAAKVAALDGGNDGTVIADALAGIVGDNAAFAQKTDVGGIDEMSGLRREWHVYGEHVGPRQSLGQALGDLDPAVELMGVRDRDRRIEADDRQPLFESGVRDTHADGSESDDHHRLAGELRSDEETLVLLDLRADVGIAASFNRQVADERDCRRHVARDHIDRGEHELLDCVGVGARGVEDGNAPLRSSFNADVVDTSTGPCDDEKFQVVVGVDLVAPHDDGMRIRNVGAREETMTIEAVESSQRHPDVIEKLNSVVHRLPLLSGRNWLTLVGCGCSTRFAFTIYEESRKVQEILFHEEF